MTKILDWRRSDDPRDVVHLAVQALVEGHVVAVPTDNCYLLLASALQSEAIERLHQSASASSETPLAVILRSANEALDLIPSISPASRRLVRKAWPGPLVLQSQNADQYSSMRCLPDRVYDRLQTSDGQVRLWQPQHEVLHYISRLVSGPIAATLAPGSSGNASFARSAAEILPGQCVLAIDGGAVEDPGEPTVVAIHQNEGRILRQGIVDRERLLRISQFVVLFVCTGNTCRSPMASALMRRKIQERFGQEFPGQPIPIIAISAGVSAFGGDPASPGALQAIRHYNASLDDHQSTQLSSSLVEQADLILAMGHRHRNVIVSQWPEIAYKVHPVAADGGEISDPFGGAMDVYQRCAEQLDLHTSHWIQALDTSSLIHWSDAESVA